MDLVVIGGGTNLIVSDAGFRGIVLRYRGDRLLAANGRVHADAGASLQDLVDFSIAHGLAGLETLSGIPGSVGAAVYGNAGAYGHSISERVVSVRFFDGSDGPGLRQRGVRVSVSRIDFQAPQGLDHFLHGSAPGCRRRAALREAADSILKVRNEKFPVTMKCAGSIFKNLLMRDLPAEVAAQVPASAVREGKVPAAWFLEQVGAKGMTRGDIHVATYHANLIYNAARARPPILCALIRELKQRVARAIRHRTRRRSAIRRVGHAVVGHAISLPCLKQLRDFGRNTLALFIFAADISSE